jgi:hypothetical protein
MCAANLIGHEKSHQAEYQGDQPERMADGAFFYGVEVRLVAYVPFLAGIVIQFSAAFLIETFFARDPGGTGLTAGIGP